MRQHCGDANRRALPPDRAILAEVAKLLVVELAPEGVEPAVSDPQAGRPPQDRSRWGYGAADEASPPARRARRTTEISCEAAPASVSAGAGMRRHVHAGNHPAEGFVSFIPLFGGATRSTFLRVRSSVSRRISRR